MYRFVVYHYGNIKEGKIKEVFYRKVLQAIEIKLALFQTRMFYIKMLFATPWITSKNTIQNSKRKNTGSLKDKLDNTYF